MNDLSVEFLHDDKQGAKSSVELCINGETVCACRGTLKELLECAQNASPASPFVDIDSPEMENLKGADGTTKLQELSKIKSDCALTGLNRMCGKIEKV